MRKFNYLLSLLVIAAVVTSCQEDIHEEINSDNGVETLITLSAERVGTKTEIDNKDADTKTSIDGLTFTWVTGDVLGASVRRRSTPTPFFLLSGTEGRALGSFEGTLSSSSADHIYAVYPYDEDKRFTNETNVEYTFALPMVQTQNHSAEGVINPKSIGDYAYMYGKTANPVEDKSNIAISMKQLMTLFDFNFTDIPNGIKIYSLTLRATENTFASTATVNLDEELIGDAQPVINLGDVSTYGRAIRVNINSGSDESVTEGVIVGENGLLTIRLAMFPQTIASGKVWSIELTTSDGNYSHTKTFDADKVYKAGFRYKAPLVWGTRDIETLKGIKINVGTEDNPKCITVSDRNVGAPTTETAGHGEEWYGDYYAWADRDVCPAHWRVPTINELEAILKNLEWNFSDNAWKLLSDYNSDFVWFPMAGYISGGELKETTHFWSNEGDNWSGSWATSLEINNPSTTSYWRNNEVSSLQVESRTSIRCVKDTTTPTTPQKPSIPSESVNVMIPATGPNEMEYLLTIADRNCELGGTNGATVGNSATDYGSYYTWSNAENNAEVTTGAYHACQTFVGADGTTDWRLPTWFEWEILSNIEYNHERKKLYWETPTWKVYDDLNLKKHVYFPLAAGKDLTLPIAQQKGIYWTSTKDDAGVWSMMLEGSKKSKMQTTHLATSEASVRCVKDNIPDLYESTDYSRNGEVLTLQSATVGNGMDIVIMGDGFIDTDMGDGGKYIQRMNEAMEHFFSEEPYITYRDYYNVYSVLAVSKNEGISIFSSTVFDCAFGVGSRITGNVDTVVEYTTKVPGLELSAVEGMKYHNLEDVTTIVILNSSRYAGTCYMFYTPLNWSISYCPAISNNTDDQFRRVVAHEAGGHGFAKLKDEYSYTGTTMTPERLETYEKESGLGWCENIDIINDPNSIKWTHFLNDPLYAGLVGIFEGAYTVEKGVYRPTDNSLMNENVGGFNAPSREAIFKRIINLSGGIYTYEQFIGYDAKNRTPEAMAARRAQIRGVDSRTFVPFAPSVSVESLDSSK